MTTKPKHPRTQPPRRGKRRPSPRNDARGRVVDAINFLMRAGCSQNTIVDMVRARQVECHQSQISRFMAGSQKRISLELGQALLAIVEDPHWKHAAQVQEKKLDAIAAGK